MERLLMCGWSRDQAYILVNDMLRELDWEGLEDFIAREECAVCG